MKFFILILFALKKLVFSEEDIITVFKFDPDVRTDNSQLEKYLVKMEAKNNDYSKVNAVCALQSNLVLTNCRL